jgi:hypothetical protein
MCAWSTGCLRRWRVSRVRGGAGTQVAAPSVNFHMAAGIDRARSAVARCASSRSSPTTSASAKFWNTSGQRRSRRTSPQHAGRRCGVESMRKMVRVWSQRRTGRNLAKRHQTLRPISASVGEGQNSGMTAVGRQTAFVTAHTWDSRHI